MKVLMIAHNCVLESNQEKLVELNFREDMDLTLLVPPYNLEPMGWVKIEKRFDPRYKIIVAHSFWPWILRQRYMQFYPALPWILRRVQPEIIDLWEEPWSFVSYLCLKLAERFAPDARIVHETEQNISKKYPPPFSIFERYVISRADHFIARNDEGVKILREKGFQGPVDVIPNALSLEAFKPINVQGLRRKLGLKNNFTVGYIGRIEQEKGLITLFEALAGVPLPFQVLVIGQGSLKSKLQALAEKKGFADRCVFLDPVPQREAPKYINCMDLMVLPSLTTPKWKEQFGRTLIEAMACGVPVIGSDSGSIPSVIGGAGLVFPEGDADRLREAIMLLMTDNRQRKDLIRLGHERVKNNFQWRGVAERMRKIYNQALGLEPVPEPAQPAPDKRLPLIAEIPCPRPDETPARDFPLLPRIESLSFLNETEKIIEPESAITGDETEPQEKPIEPDPDKH